MSEVPSLVTESTAIEVKRKEGATISAKSVASLSAGDILGFPNASGVQKATGASNTLGGIAGVALFAATSGQRVTIIKGLVRATWDGTGTVVFGTPIGVSTTNSGWFEPSATTSGAATIGFFFGTGAGSSLAAANSGTLQVVEIQ